MESVIANANDSGADGAGARETKAARFKRIATRRTQRILDALRVLGNCANRSVYDYTDDDVRKIFSALEKQLADTKAKFKDSGRREFRL